MFTIYCDYNYRNRLLRKIFLLYLGVGSNVTIECVAVGEPPPRMSWYKVGDGQSLPNNRTEFLPGGLHLRNIVPEDTGEYVCEINNSISPVLRHNVLLHVQGQYYVNIAFSKIHSSKLCNYYVLG